jgi:hypothetical protein
MPTEFERIQQETDSAVEEQSCGVSPATTEYSAGKPPCKIDPAMAEVQADAELMMMPVGFPAFLAAKLAAEPAEMPPAMPEALATRASPERSTNLGSATAAKMPNITMTITNSMSVNPSWLDLGVCVIFIP